jgi:hypothetical protein
MRCNHASTPLIWCMSPSMADANASSRSPATFWMWNTSLSLSRTRRMANRWTSKRSSEPEIPLRTSVPLPRCQDYTQCPKPSTPYKLLAGRSAPPASTSSDNSDLIAASATENPPLASTANTLEPTCYAPVAPWRSSSMTIPSPQL